MRMPAMDKQLHFLAGAAIAASVALYLDPVAGLAAGIFAGAAKEAVDRMGFGAPDVKDFIATALGACVALPAVCGIGL